MFREQLILKALAALSEIADECGQEPARKSLMLRFLLAYTFAAAGSRPDIKWIWNDFWRHATAPRAEIEHKQLIDDYVRGSGARSALNGICREIGYPVDNELITMLRDGWGQSRDARCDRKAVPAAANDDPDGGEAA